MRQRVADGDGAFAEKLDAGFGAVVGEEHSLFAVRLHALVVSVAGAAGVVDAAEDAAFGSHDDHCGVNIVQLHDARVYQDGALRHDGFRLVGEDEACEVQVVDHHVLEDAAGDAEVFQVRRGGVAGGDDELLQFSDVAAADALAQGGMSGVKAAVEADLDGGRVWGEFVEGVAALVGAVEVQVHGFFAEDGEAALGGLEDELAMGWGGGGDEDGADVVAGEGVFGVLGDGDIVHFGDGAFGGGGVRVVDGAESEVGMRGEVFGVHPPDSPGAEYGNSDGHNRANYAAIPPEKNILRNLGIWAVFW